MPKYEISYELIEDNAAKRAAAIRDIKAYLGDETWSKIEKSYYLCDGDPEVFNVKLCSVRSELRRGLNGICLFFLGIEGYPVIALQNLVLTHHLNKLRNNV